MLNIGIELKASDGLTMKKTVETLMRNKREQFQKYVDYSAHCAEASIGDGGSSNNNLEIIVSDEKKMKLARELTKT